MTLAFLTYIYHLKTQLFTTKDMHKWGTNGESENFWRRSSPKIALHFRYMLCARAQITILSLTPTV